MSTNNSRENIICRTQGSGEEQRERERKRARINWGRMSEEDRQRRRARERERRRNYSEERRQAERVRARENRQNVNEERREAERLRAVENRQNYPAKTPCKRRRLRAVGKTDKIVAKRGWSREFLPMIMNYRLKETLKFSNRFLSA